MAMAFLSDDWQRTLKAASRITSLPRSWLNSDEAPVKNWPGELSNEGLTDPEDDLLVSDGDLHYACPSADVSFELSPPSLFASYHSTPTLSPPPAQKSPQNSWSVRVMSKHYGLTPLFIPDMKYSPICAPSPSVPRTPLRSNALPLTPYSTSLPDLVPATPASPYTPCNSVRSRSPSTPYTPSSLKPKLEDQSDDFRKNQASVKRASRKRRAEEALMKRECPSPSPVDAPDVPVVPRFAETLSELRSFIVGDKPVKKARRPPPVSQRGNSPSSEASSELTADRDLCQRSSGRSVSRNSMQCGSESESPLVPAPGGLVECLLTSSSGSEAAGSECCVSSADVPTSCLDYMDHFLLSTFADETPLPMPYSEVSNLIDLNSLLECAGDIPPSHPHEFEAMAGCGDETTDWLSSLLSSHNVDSENRLLSSQCN